MCPAIQDLGDELLSLWAIFLCPADDPRWCPLKISLMALGHVPCRCCKGLFAVVFLMTCHPFIFKQYLHGTGGKADINLLSCKLIRYAVVVAGNLNMVVDIDPGLFPLSGKRQSNPSGTGMRDGIKY